MTINSNIYVFRHEINSGRCMRAEGTTQRRGAHARPNATCAAELVEETITSTLQFARGHDTDDASALAEAGAEDLVRVLEHAVLQADDDELRALEARLDDASDVLCVRQVERRVYFVENVHWCRLELQQGQDQ